MRISKQIIIPIIVICIVVWGFFYFKNNNNNIWTNKIKNNTVKENKIVFEEKEIKNINPLKEINFETKEINPDDYITLWDFLKRVKTWTWMNIDLVKEDFVIQNNTWSWTFRVFRFRQDFINNDPVLSSRQAKNEAVLDIFDAYKNKSIYRTWDSNIPWSKISFWEELMHPSTNMINAIFTKQLNMYDLMKDFESRKKLSIYDAELLSYLYDLNWDYAKANKSREDNCKTFPQTCIKKLNVVFKWKILDEKNNPVSWAKVKLLNKEWIESITNKSWEYEIKFESYPFSHIRLKSSKLGYSDGFISSSINMYYVANSYNEIRDFTLNKANKVETVWINDAKNWYYTFKTEQSIYKVPKDWLFYMNGKKYIWNKLSVYLYEFNKWSRIDNLMEVDTFTPVYWYVGNIMKTFWMPYIQFFDDNSNEVFIKKSNPIILTNQIYHMKELYDNYDKIYEPLTKEDMKKLVQVSKEKWGYPIDMKFLTENNMLRWPAWWVLDRAKWIWQNIGCKVLNENWLVELPFYSINDQ